MLLCFALETSRVLTDGSVRTLAMCMVSCAMNIICGLWSNEYAGEIIRCTHHHNESFWAPQCIELLTTMTLFTVVLRINYPQTFPSGILHEYTCKMPLGRDHSQRVESCAPCLFKDSRSNRGENQSSSPARENFTANLQTWIQSLLNECWPMDETWQLLPNRCTTREAGCQRVTDPNAYQIEAPQDPNRCRPRPHLTTAG